MTPNAAKLGRVLVLGGALGLAACGGGSTGSGAASALPKCANRSFLATRVNLLPQSSRLYTHRKELGADVFGAMAPGSIDSVRREYKRHLEEQGYTITGGEAEEHDAEAEFEGNGRSGRLKLRELPGCGGAVQVQISLRRH